MPHAAGIILREPHGLMLLLRRAGAGADNLGTWCWPGGGIEGGETPEEAARRELLEETGIKFSGPLTQVDDRGGFITFLGETKFLEPSLNDEHDDWIWAQASGLPEPLHPGVAATLSDIELPKGAEMTADAALRRRDRLSFDRKSVRRIDEDGHLHVERSNISAARVNPYYGREIPDYERLGLEPSRTYKLLRHPDELKAAADSFNGKPLMSRHVPVSADEPQKNAVVGAINNVRFEDPFLVAELVVWDAEAIAGIESEEQKELSCGYRYVADMTPGEYQGEKYDGVMREISGNHVALVPEGRAGPDVVVGDQKPKGQPMKLITKALPSRKALLVQGALSALLAPKLATDAKLDLSLALDGVNRSNFKAKKAGIAKSLEKALGGKLAQDEGLGEVVEAVAELLDNLEGVQSGGPDDDDLSADEDKDEGEKKDDEVEAKDEDPAKTLEDLKGKIPEDLLAQVAKALTGGAQDEDKDCAKDEDKEDGEKVEKTAMDAAIRKATEATRRETIRQMNAISAAKAAVRPHVGELEGAFDSAEDVYKLALDHAIENGVDLDLSGVPASAYAAMVKMLPPAGEKKTAARREQAHDAKLADELFPGLARIKHV